MKGLHHEKLNKKELGLVINELRTIANDLPEIQNKLMQILDAVNAQSNQVIFGSGEAGVNRLVKTNINPFSILLKQTGDHLNKIAADLQVATY